MTAHALKGTASGAWSPEWTAIWPNQFAPEKLFRTIEEVMSKPAAPIPVPTSPQEDFDWSGAMEAVQGDEALLKVIVEAMIEECPLVMELVRHGDL